MYFNNWQWLYRRITIRSTTAIKIGAQFQLKMQWNHRSATVAAMYTRIKKIVSIFLKNFTKQATHNIKNKNVPNNKSHIECLSQMTFLRCINVSGHWFYICNGHGSKLYGGFIVDQWRRFINRRGRPLNTYRTKNQPLLHSSVS